MQRSFGVQDVSCILYDFDGVMTDNRVLVDQNGIEAVFVNRSDGYAISRLTKCGIAQAIISTEENPVVECRAKKLRIPVVHGVEDKGVAVLKYCEENSIDLSRVLFVGNDINDLPAFEIVGYRAVPYDAEEDVKGLADWISTRKGGYGVIRELYGFLMESDKKA